MLTEEEKISVKDFLRSLPHEELFHLSKAVTAGMVSSESVEDACNNILQHGSDVRSILNRRRITKTMLFNYLHAKGVGCLATSRKHDLMGILMDFWQNHSSHKASLEVKPQLSSLYVKELSFKFCEWFYRKLNEIITDDRSISSGDFWENSSAVLNFVSGPDCSELYEASGRDEIASVLRRMQCEYKLHFFPNLSDFGVRGRAEPHGIIAVMACGTLHKGEGICVGVFEQTFLLIQDPYSIDNWKIKRTEMTLKSDATIVGQPCLPPSSP